MNYRNLGSSGLQVSLVGLGCNNFGMRIELESARLVVHKALDVGITLFDTADIYGNRAGGNRGGSETMLGQILGDRRKDVILATKFGGPMADAKSDAKSATGKSDARSATGKADGTSDLSKTQGASRRYIFSEVETSLARLQTDYIDLYQLHFPDPHTPMEETLRALDDLVRQGKVRYLGISNHAAWQVVDAAWISRYFDLASFVCSQDEYSLLHRDPERELLPALEAFGMGLLPYFPLASGLLTGKYQRNVAPPADTRFATIKRLSERYATDANWQILEQLENFCASRRHTLLELAFSWLAARPMVASVIAGATKPEQVAANAAAADWALSAAEIAEVDGITDRNTEKK